MTVRFLRENPMRQYAHEAAERVRDVVNQPMALNAKLSDHDMLRSIADRSPFGWSKKPGHGVQNAKGNQVAAFVRALGGASTPLSFAHKFGAD